MDKHSLSYRLSLSGRFFAAVVVLLLLTMVTLVHTPEQQKQA